MWQRAWAEMQAEATGIASQGAVQGHACLQTSDASSWGQQERQPQGPQVLAASPWCSACVARRVEAVTPSQAMVATPSRRAQHVRQHASSPRSHCSWNSRQRRRCHCCPRLPHRHRLCLRRHPRLVVPAVRRTQDGEANAVETPMPLVRGWEAIWIAHEPSPVPSPRCHQRHGCVLHMTPWTPWRGLESRGDCPSCCYCRRCCCGCALSWHCRYRQSCRCHCRYRRLHCWLCHCCRHHRATAVTQCR